MPEIDTSVAYRHPDFRGVAFRVLGHPVEEVFDDLLICDDEECDHQLSEMCWTVYVSNTVSLDMVRAVMIGDDREHLLSVDDLEPLEDDAFCRECGQIGCAHSRVA